MSVTTMIHHRDPRPVLVVEASRCDCCGTPSTRLREVSGWSWSLGETVEASVCPTCLGEDE